MSHLLIDRFRFDSFRAGAGKDTSRPGCSRGFGDLVYMFFMITPPEMDGRTRVDAGG